jgi:uncharacterized protein (TIGR03435 family)
MQKHFGVAMAVGLGLVLALPVPLSVWGQAPVATFDVATIKPGDADKNHAELMMSQGGFDTRNQTLLDLIKFAYGLNSGSNEQISGGPKWAGTALFDIDAKEDEQTIAALKAMGRDERVEQVRLMVRTLLAERFGLKVHHETRPLQVFSLTVAKGGPKMTPAVETPPQEGQKPKGSGVGGRGPGSLEGINVTMAIFVTPLSRQSEVGGRMVVDNTGLPGKYNFTLKWTPENGAAGSDATAPGLFTALQEQLGLKLEATRALMDTIVVDAAQMPGEN